MPPVSFNGSPACPSLNHRAVFPGGCHFLIYTEVSVYLAMDQLVREGLPERVTVKWRSERGALQLCIIENKEARLREPWMQRPECSGLAHVPGTARRQNKPKRGTEDRHRSERHIELWGHYQNWSFPSDKESHWRFAQSIILWILGWE